MKGIAVAFFQNLFSLSDASDVTYVIPRLFPEIDVVQYDSLTKPISMCEVKMLYSLSED